MTTFIPPKFNYLCFFDRYLISSIEFEETKVFIAYTETLEEVSRLNFLIKNDKLYLQSVVTHPSHHNKNCAASLLYSLTVLGVSFFIPAGHVLPARNTLLLARMCRHNFADLYINGFKVAHEQYAEVMASVHEIECVVHHNATANYVTFDNLGSQWEIFRNNGVWYD